MTGSNQVGGSPAPGVTDHRHMVCQCRHADAVTVIETAGEHATMLSSANAETTAASLTRCLPA